MTDKCPCLTNKRIFAMETEISPSFLILAAKNNEAFAIQDIDTKKAPCECSLYNASDPSYKCVTYNDKG